MFRVVALAAMLGATACATTKETEAKPFELPSAEDIKAAELAEWDLRQDYFRNRKMVGDTATEIKLMAVTNLKCEPMFDSWAECKYDVELLGDIQTVVVKEIFGQFTPEP